MAVTLIGQNIDHPAHMLNCLNENHLSQYAEVTESDDLELA